MGKKYTVNIIIGLAWSDSHNHNDIFPDCHDYNLCRLSDPTT